MDGVALLPEVTSVDDTVGDAMLFSVATVSVVDPPEPTAALVADAEADGVQQER